MLIFNKYRPIIALASALIFVISGMLSLKADKISDALSDNFGASGTIVNAVGGYSKQQKEIVYFIINHFQINKLKKIVHEIDGNAFISLQEVSDIIKTQNT